MILINPNAGGGQAQGYFYREVEPLLLKKYELSVYNSPSADIAKKAIEDAGDDLLSYHGVVGIGGDGTIYEIYKALLNSKYSFQAIKDIAVGHIPMGSGNALARSIYDQDCKEEGEYSARALVDGLIKGDTAPLDLWSFETDTDKSGIFFLGFSYGIISDIDIESEWLRWPFGSLRFDIYGAYHWFLNRSYEAKITLKLDDKEEEIKGPFREIWSVNIPYAHEKICVAPKAKLDDGYLHTMMLKTKDTGWFDMLSFLLNLDSEDMHNLTFVNMHRAQEIYLETDINSRLTIDGELFPQVTKLKIKRLPVKGKVFRAHCS